MTRSQELRTSYGAPSFQWSHLWGAAIVNPVNLKSYTIPIFNLRDPYARVFHLSWLGFFSAFLSWFAFPPLIPEAIKSDLKLTDVQVANSNVVALVATLVVRAGVGPLVDHYGPRKTMAGLLLLGAIPSGLAGTAHSAKTLYLLRFFIGILGATFVPCQAWTSAFFDKSCVGAANALVGGWGSGGATFVIMTTLFRSLMNSFGASAHVAWRVAFVVVPVPILLFVGTMVLIFGQDHPAGKWSERHNLPATTLAAQQGHEVIHDDITSSKKNTKDSEAIVTVQSVMEEEKTPIQPSVDVAVNESLTLGTTVKIFLNPLTWLPALAYLTTFGVELAIDGTMAGVLFSLYSGKRPGFTQATAGYYTSIFGFLNIVTRPFGGYFGDVLYRSFGTKGKKIWTLLCGLIMGITLLVGGFYLQRHRVPGTAELTILMGVFSISAIFSELGNGANFALVPHCNSYNNGVMSGLVGACGNLGGVIFSLVFRFQSQAGKAFWIMGVICLAINTLLFTIPVPTL
ncbi:putative high affinity nitrate transporter protein 2 [Macrolepiota fuliginosa MF-IS2]|uniref:Nitrate/nitrite transporter n=1 Tax=Macrolepiota fuliginosa MF-IS2 TaxID=1400762 RepID=A0A9P6C2Q3_9AGAR|nr:putative high affinity nitrate transporter protein 2 [Macrolepiota fuliginosa MF-IS2]